MSLLTADEIRAATQSEKDMRQLVFDRIEALMPLKDKTGVRDRFETMSNDVRDFPGSTDQNLMNKVAALEIDYAQKIMTGHRPHIQAAQKSLLKDTLIPSWPVVLAIADMVRLAAAPCAMRYYTTRAFNIRTKPFDHTPFTEADLAVQNIIQSGLRALAPNIPFLGEEGLEKRHPNRPFKNKDGQFWLVDPIDGTQTFVSGHPGWSINVALIRNGRPALGIVYVPALDRLYMGLPHQKMAQIRTSSGLTKSIHTRIREADRRTMIKGYAKHAPDALAAFADANKVRRTFKQAGASFRLCRIAEGRADLYAQVIPYHELDTAAGQAVLEAAGGVVIDLKTRETVSYGHQERGFKVPPLAAAAARSLLPA